VVGTKAVWPETGQTANQSTNTDGLLSER